MYCYFSATVASPLLFILLSETVASCNYEVLVGPSSIVICRPSLLFAPIRLMKETNVGTHTLATKPLSLRRSSRNSTVATLMRWKGVLLLRGPLPFWFGPGLDVSAVTAVVTAFPPSEIRRFLATLTVVGFDTSVTIVAPTFCN
jgi:hypothetical protein